MTDQEPRRGLEKLLHLDWLPATLFGGRMRTSTFILIVAWLLAGFAHSTFNPVPQPVSPAPAADSSVTEPYVQPRENTSTESTTTTTTAVPTTTESAPAGTGGSTTQRAPGASTTTGVPPAPPPVSEEVPANPGQAGVTTSTATTTTPPLTQAPTTTETR
ncbi:hypothetical protein [Rhodococcus sp. IEGM 1379]|uniref:hypothetical protein n=1 Tax=Rhodococcus sp. IEGM 1379 TaxID=3047086 RepID=UPI0024B7E68C|nr:hypothetical protein [Rhodococcus sp. IEGM 1379]MDI9917954.1 hypothetical protein [Rhodococcus sp. IEGM 1379]